MPRSIVIVMMMVVSTLCCTADPYLFVQMRSGDIMYYKLAERPKIQYSSIDMIVQTKTGTPTSIPIDEVRNIQYTPPTNISLLFNNLSGLALVYSATGEYIAMLNEPEDVNGLDLPVGVYVIRLNNAAQKIVVQ